jgi:hypothetical protein
MHDTTQYFFMIPSAWFMASKKNASDLSPVTENSLH